VGPSLERKISPGRPEQRGNVAQDRVHYNRNSKGRLHEAGWDSGTAFEALATTIILCKKAASVLGTYDKQILSVLCCMTSIAQTPRKSTVHSVLTLHTSYCNGYIISTHSIYALFRVERRTDTFLSRSPTRRDSGSCIYCTDVSRSLSSILTSPSPLSFLSIQEC